MYFSKHKGSIKRGFESEKKIRCYDGGEEIKSVQLLKKKINTPTSTFGLQARRTEKDIQLTLNQVKKISRVDKYVNLDEVWIEYNNTYNGKKGWIHGEADFIAFELNKTFLVVKLRELKKLCDKLINKNIPAKSSEEALYYFWTRPEHRRKGIMERAARIKVSDIKENLKYVEYEKPSVFN